MKGCVGFALVVLGFGCCSTDDVLADNVDCVREAEYARDVCVDGKAGDFKGCMQKNLHAECRSVIQTPKPAWAIEGQCKEEMLRASSACGNVVAEETTSCLKPRISSFCMEQAKSGMPLDAACRQESSNAAKACSGVAIEAERRCTSGHMSNACAQELAKSERIKNESENACRMATNQITKLCGDYFKNQKCYEENRRLTEGPCR